MAAIGRVLARAFSADEGANTSLVIIVFCMAGLVASLLVAKYGADINVVWPDADF